MRIVEAEWSVSKPAELVTEQFVENLGEPERVVDETRVWTHRQWWGLEQMEVTFDESSGRVTFTKEAPEWLRYGIVLSGVLVVAVLFFGAEVAKTWTAIAVFLLFLLVDQLIQIPLAEKFDIEAHTVSPYYFATMFIAAASILAVPLVTVILSDVLVVGAVVMIVGMHYAQGSLPLPEPYSPEPRDSPSHLVIPIMGLAAPLGGYASLTIFATLRMTDLPYWVVVAGSGGAVLFGTWFYGLTCQDMLAKLSRENLGAYRSRPVQYVALLLYVGVYLSTFVMLVIAAEFLSLGTFDSWIFIAENTETTEIYTTIYENLDQVFAGVPVVPARAFSVGFVAMLFAPMFVLLVGWLYHLYSSLKATLTLFRNGTVIDVDFDVLPADVDVLLVDSDLPMVQPVSVLLGWREYVAISRVVYESLTDEQLEAVVAHEVYHLRNRDLVVNTVAGVASVGAFGGLNALLAFYDYPRIEAEADEYAAEHVGVEPLVGALRRMEQLRQRDKIDKNVTEFQRESPQFINPIQEWSRSLHRIIRPVRSFYQLFYGRVLVDQAHQPIDDRIARVLWRSSLDTTCSSE